PRLSEPRAGRGDPARPATRRAHCDAPYRTRSAARLDRSAQPAGGLMSDPQQREPRPRPGLFSLLRFDFPRGDCSNAGQRKATKASRLGASTSRSLVFAQAHTPGKNRVFPAVGMGGTGETDSPLEGAVTSEPVSEPQIP